MTGPITSWAFHPQLFLCQNPGPGAPRRRGGLCHQHGTPWTPKTRLCAAISPSGPTSLGRSGCPTMRSVPMPGRMLFHFIIFLQKRDRPLSIEPEWVHLGQNEDGFSINSYFIDHPEMILGRQTAESTQYGRQDFTVVPLKGWNFPISSMTR